MARRSDSPVVILSILLVLSLAGWFGFDYLHERLSSSSCDTVATLSVVAAPGIASAVARVSEQDGAACYRVEVIARDSAEAVGSLAQAKPDVWIPESSQWLLRAQRRGAWDIPVTGPSIASSPIVLGLTETAARQFGWPERTPTWAQVFSGEPAIGFVDPAVDPAGLSALIATGELTGSAPDPAGSYALTLRKLTKHAVQKPAELFDPARPLDGVVTPESDLGKHGLVGVYADPAVPSLDYPYVVLPGPDQSKRDVAQQFLSRLLDQTSAGQFAEEGLRGPDGRALGGSSAAVVRPVAPPADPDQLLNQWAAVNRSARMQVLLDVSGSMAQGVPKAATDRMTLTIRAAELGIRLFKPTTKIGLWRFSTNLDGDKDYKELLPVRPVGELLADGSLDELRKVKAIHNGATGLYDSVLAAYTSARENWEPGRINLVVVLTDGKNEDPQGINQEQLLAQLAELQDPKRPLQIIGIGIGPDIDPVELRAISRATGGDAYTTEDPTKIVDVFYAAMGRLLET
ncbi:substrate-binding domain-containing protein [Lentzea sp. BCCO 10_0856]|uniref:Substrate-binding domain-containing protein n=1 Tax=Lentzea miocenica TaxID=3095431 RepID=A0ABU4TGC1_9PSEU|nr:substrate-binding domain-containing protein [Lentzea sp. BCCO 10_0856]MDX8037044.1 substrate-binding domain-containing protein [Lentzea sp. BCCO 10_0856]